MTYLYTQLNNNVGIIENVQEEDRMTANTEWLIF